MKSKNNEKKNIKTDCEIVDEAMCAYDEYKDIYMFNDSTWKECKYADIPEEMKEKLRPLARERARKWYLENKEYKNQYDKERRIEKHGQKDKRMIIVYDEIDDKQYGSSPKWGGRGLINIKNDDYMCFKYCVNYHFLSKTIVKNAERVSALKKVNHYNFEKMNFPCGMNDVKRFERNNKVISINVFSEEDKIIKKIYSSSNDSDDVCNLFMKETNDGNNFFYIKNMNSFIRDECKKNKKNELCINCCEGFDKRYKHNCST